MKAADFSYEKPQSLAAALNLIAKDDREFQILAGGQSLMPMMNFRLAQPEVLVDLNGLDELKFIVDEEDTISIGAMTRYAELASSDLVQDHIPLFKMALPHIAHAAVRNRGTIGGSVALADPAAEMPALLMALDAQITVASQNDERVIAANDFFLGIYETALAEGEIVKSISIPKTQAGNQFGFYELARRHGDYAMAGAVVKVSTAAPITDIKAVLFSVSDRAVRLPDLETALEDRSLADVDLDALVSQALNNVSFHADLNADENTKRHLGGVVMKRALREMSS